MRKPVEAPHPRTGRHHRRTVEKEADKVAAAFNAYWGAYLAMQRAQSVAEGKNPDHWPTVTAAVVEWDSAPKQHASNLKRYWHDYAEYLKFAAETGEAG